MRVSVGAYVMEKIEVLGHWTACIRRIAAFGQFNNTYYQKPPEGSNVVKYEMKAR